MYSYSTFVSQIGPWGGKEGGVVKGMTVRPMVWTVSCTAILLILPKRSAIRRNDREGRVTEPRSTEDRANPTVHERILSGSWLHEKGALQDMHGDDYMEYGEQDAIDRLLMKFLDLFVRSSRDCG